MISKAIHPIVELPSAGRLSNDRKLRSYVDSRHVFYLLKRMIDIVFSLGAIVFVLSWLMPLVALLIRIESSGPIFFIQRRVGRGGRSFLCLKFRTMVLNRDADLCQAQQKDRRITKIGQILRMSNLDEFPQFLNVLKGDMSIVGPRPHMHSDCTRFGKLVPAYKFRNLVRPGITGLAQVKGYRGPTRDFASVFHRYQLDAFYIRNANFWLDMRIIRKTASQTIFALVKKIRPGKMENATLRARLPQRKWVAAIRSLLS